ncbi:hypothetical protein ASE00_18490 [Sphingomonas sp. Root710]|uniref:methyl-accepting chemotaxis protein n=1 Tax=Sphingomonas sp. Root710 TaxID=1736594 RepID=UPI0006F63B2D|nr:methyl-accepting chemotaxis protein [Sphingomonas sp. Root710]KRB79704.1 hypothetical protein ASE00_18490 [Sphingomonas sp. Root710]
MQITVDNSTSNFWQRLGAPLIALVGTLLVCVFALFYWLTLQQDRLSIAQEQQLTSAALSARVEFLRRNLGDYAVWDDIVHNLIEKRDYDWADANIGPYLFTMQGYDYTLVLDGHGEAVYASAGNKRTSRLLARIDDGALGRLIAALARQPGTDRRKVVLARIDGIPALLGAAAIIPSTPGAKLPPPHYLVLIKKLDSSVMEALSRDYALRGLRIAGPNVSDGPGMALLTDDGRSIGKLMWIPLGPGSKLRSLAWPLLMTLSLIAAGGVWLLLRQSWVSVKARAEAQAEALDSARQAADANQRLVDAEKERQRALEKAVAAAREENAVLNAAAERERALARQAEARSLNNAADHLEDEIGTVASALAIAAGALEETAEAVRRTAEMSSRSASDVATASHQTRTHLEEIVPEASALANSMADVRSNMATAVEAVSQARDEARVAVVRMSDLTKAVDQIGGIVGAIGELTSQTNLLALNAAIEAARAGSAGHGFAVVADEVRRLAAHTGDLLTQIDQQVQAIRSTSQESERITMRVGSLLGPAVDASANIASAIDRQNQSIDAMGVSFQRVTQVAADLVTLSTLADDAAREGFAAADVVKSTASGVADESVRLNGAVVDVQYRLRGQAKDEVDKAA